MNGDTFVGEPVYGGVLSRTRANLDKGCRAMPVQWQASRPCLTRNTDRPHGCRSEDA
jgi:hypothetical protein